MNVSRLLHLFALTSFSIFSIATLAHGAQPASATPKKTYKDKPISLAERIRVTKLLNDHADEIKEKFGSSRPIEFSWLQGYYIKLDTTRVSYAHALKNCIQKHNLTLVTVPEKWIYKIPNYHDYQQQTHLVVAKKLKGSDVGIINNAQTKEICILLKNAHINDLYYWDLKNSNLVQCDDGRIGFIDTERMGFVSRAQQYTCIMHRLLYNSSFNDEAKALIRQELDEIK